MEPTKPLVGLALAKAAHDYCRREDSAGEGVQVAQIEEGVQSLGMAIGGQDTRQTLNSALNHSQDLFKRVRPGTWRWIEPTRDTRDGISGASLAEEAYRVAIHNDPDREGIHYGRVLNLLVEEGTVVQGGNPGQTVFSAMNSAKDLVDWVSSGRFKWK